ncbi:hypothetical protein ACLOJK_016759 [Asimina triloba]
MARLHFLCFLALLFSTAKSQAMSTDPSYYYNLCAPFTCNNVTLRYPLIPTQFCHDPDLIPTCPNNDYLLLKSPQPSDTYRMISNITGDSSSETIFVAPNSLFGCGQVTKPIYNVDASVFSLLDNYTYGTYLNCTSPIISNTIQPASCLDCDADRSSNVCYYVQGFVTVSGCETFAAFTPKGVNVSAVKDLRAFFQNGYEIRYTKPLECQSCEASGGRCGASPQQKFVCFCPSSVHNANCSDALRLIDGLHYLGIDLPQLVVDLLILKARNLIGLCPAGDPSVDRTRNWLQASSQNPFVLRIIHDLQFISFTYTCGFNLILGLSILGAALSASAAALALISLATVAIVFIYRRRRLKEKDDDDDENGPHENDRKQTELEDLVTSMAPAKYSYSQIKKFTSDFSNKLGQGGFGSVYKGVIKQGRRKDSKEQLHVAIKVLKDSKQSQKQFMNEVATVGRIHHSNLVRMLGYCAEGKTRALVYEFVEKGSLEKFIHNTKRKSEEVDSVERLSPQQLYKIAIETARGVLYLHQGCRSRILHCDIKPHNVLLDPNYSAKVADFGLARMIAKDRSHVTLTVGQGGTPGYAPPEMWSKSYGPITEKSDVYSYGMLLLEMAGGRKNYDEGASASSQIYFPKWAFQQAARGGIEGGGDEKELEGEDGNVVRRMCLVGLWCIQHIPMKRPSMSKVIQMLEGTAEIGRPPHPFPGEESTGELNFTNFSASNSNVDISNSYKTDEEYGEDGS